MTRELVYSPDFIRAAKKFRKKHSNTDDLAASLEMLQQDAFDPRLKTHKLGGKLKGSWACSVSFDLRIVFSFVKKNNK